MMEQVTVTFFGDPFRDLDQEITGPAILIEGLPGIGQVGKVVADYLIEELHAEKIAEIHSLFFPPQVILQEDGTVRLAGNEIYRYQVAEQTVYFLVGDCQSLSNEGHYLLAEQYLQIAARLGIKKIYTLGGYGVGHLVDEPRVLCAVNDPALRAPVEEVGGIFTRDEPGGGIVGAAGLLLGLGARQGIGGICLMGETSGYLIDPKSAHNLLSLLCRITGLVVDTSRLHERADDMEQVLAEVRESELVRKNDELRYIG
ncbi:proteasome assembly chaperone family protein [Methanosphaerula subterraneus]|uniref:proteasome assembly chaperone family protein n=1 Tax=Methanosphaerula subterraneus TaxID=3350244 RepID=UPI003F852857